MQPLEKLESDEEKVAWICDKSACGRVTIVLIGADYQRPTCGFCGGNAHMAKGELASTVCGMSACKRYLLLYQATDGKGRCEGTRNSNICQRQPITLAEALETAPPWPSLDEDDSVPAPVRQLRAAVAQGRSFVSSSGSHHRSTGGSHSTSAEQQHQNAHHAKMLVRERLAANILDLVEVVNGDSTLAKVYKQELADARGVANSVRGK